MNIRTKMNTWHEQHLAEVTQLIFNEFKFLYLKCQRRGETPYALALNFSNHVTQVSSAISMLESLKTKHYGCKWQSYGWIYTLLEHDVDPNLEQFSKKMIEYYWEEMIPRIQQGQSKQVEQNLEFFIQATLQAKQKLIADVDPKIEKIIFLFGFYNQPQLEADMAKRLNAKSRLLNEFLADHQQNLNEAPDDLPDWHREHVDVLAQSIINEFEFLQNKIKHKKIHKNKIKKSGKHRPNNKIYAVTLNLDDDAITAYLAVATTHELQKHANEYGHWEDKWASNEWKITVKSKQVKDDISELFLTKIWERYHHEIQPLFEEMNEPEDLPYEEGWYCLHERKHNCWLYIEGLKQAKRKLSKKYGQDVEDIIFYVAIFGDWRVESDSAQAINKPSALLDELLAESSWWADE